MKAEVGTPVLFRARLDFDIGEDRAVNSHEPNSRDTEIRVLPLPAETGACREQALVAGGIDERLDLAARELLHVRRGLQLRP